MSNDRDHDADDQPVAPGDAEPAPSAGPSPDAADQVLSGSQEEDDLAQQLHEAQDRVLRAQAELENFRKRSRRELDDALRYASLPLMRDLLGVIDNLERAIESAEQSNAGEGLLEGVKMVAQQLKNALAERGCEPIDSLGAAFDPNRHEAIAQEPSGQYPPGAVSRVVQAGYQLHDRVVRPSQVFVSTGPGKTE